MLVVTTALFAGLTTIAVLSLLTNNPERTVLIAKYGTPFGAGILLTAAFFDLLPHGIEEEGAVVLNGALGAIVLFFFLEKAFKNFHHHHEEDQSEKKKSGQGWLILFGEVLHNLIDGLALGSAFLISTETGFLATLALISHDLPMKLSEFSIQLKSGFTRVETIKRNIFAAFATVIAAIFAYQFASNLELPMGYLYGAIAGFFIYIALSDIVPTIHSSEEKTIGLQTIFLLIGLISGFTIASYLHSFIDSETEADHDHEHEEVLIQESNLTNENSSDNISSELLPAYEAIGCTTILNNLNELEVYTVAIERPFPGEVINGNYEVIGCSSAFEATVIWELLDQYGNIVDTYFTNGGSFEVDKFSFDLNTTEYVDGKYFLRVMETDPSDGESSLMLDQTLLPIYINNNIEEPKEEVSVEYFKISVEETVPELLQVIEVELDTKAVIQIESSIDTELHFHGYDIYLNVKSDEVTEIAFDFNIAGEFEVEDHEGGYEIARIIVKP